MGPLIAIISGVMGGTYSYYMRRSMDRGAMIELFTVAQLLFGVVIATLLGPIFSGNYHGHPYMLISAFIIGLSNGTLLAIIAQALRRGPPGFIFAMINSACVMPPLIMTLLFDLPYTIWNAVGALFVIGGLTWAGISSRTKQQSWGWIPFGVAGFVLQTLYYSSIQWRALHLENVKPNSNLLLSLSADEAATEWFLPLFLLGGATAQLLLLLPQGRLFPRKEEWKIGALGGFANALAIFGLIWALYFALPSQQCLLFPLQAITVILCCNLWGQWLYKEKVNWKANALCMFGVLLPQAACYF